ncbi:MAG: Lrp/AsnC ligand binding domain-containing protein [Nitrosotalea sp.]
MTQEISSQFDAKRDKKIQDDKICPTFAFIICQPGKETLVIRKLQTLKSVKEIHQTRGKYDILVKLENMTESELRELISSEILHMEVVLSVMNLTSACAK